MIWLDNEPDMMIMLMVQKSGEAPGMYETLCL